MITKNKLPFLVFFLISFSLFIFYLFYVNFSIDTLILFISQKIFFGKWLAKGIIPLYNSHLFVGIPFLFDPGMGNLHPFNLFFLFPYPYSFAFWSASTALLFLVGFYLLFQTFSKNELTCLILTLIVYFSGSGFCRTNNPTMSLVIAHFGLFSYSTQILRKKNISWLMLVSGFFLTISGHIQFVFYGYMIGFIVGWLFYKVSIKKLILNFALLGLVISWYYLLCLPIVLSSTRLTTHKDYANIGPLNPLQTIQLFMPLFFGYVQNGSKWNVGPTFVILISTLFIPGLLYLFTRQKIDKKIIIVCLFFMVAALGFINFPFFRGAAQSFIIIHIMGLVLFAQYEKQLYSVVTRLRKDFIIFCLVFSIFSFSFFFSKLFSICFFLLYHTVKKIPTLFYDELTVETIGRIIGINFILLFILFLTLYFIQIKKKYVQLFLFTFIIFEGIFINFFYNYFIPQSVLLTNQSLIKKVKGYDYRLQPGTDVIPYFGFHNYMSEVLFRPPFSKEPTSFDIQEQKSFNHLKNLFTFYPSTWAMTNGLNVIQGYNTFVPKKLADYFKESSSDYKKEYDYIIKRNSLYGKSEIGLDINGIETSKITLYDKRWEDLAVRYFISDRPLAKYKLIYKDHRYFYENEKAPPIYGLVENNKITIKSPYYEDPNQMNFKIQKSEVGKILQIIINPDGFVVEQNEKRITPKTKDFKLLIPLTESGEIRVFYSPIEHLRQVSKMR